MSHDIYGQENAGGADYRYYYPSDDFGASGVGVEPASDIAAYLLTFCHPSKANRDALTEN